MNRFEKFAVAAVAVTLLLFGHWLSSSVRLYEEMFPLSDTEWLMAGVGWILLTFGPILAAVCFWRLAKEARAPWVPHLLVWPSVFMLARAGGTIMVSGLKDYDGDSLAFGGLTMPASLLFLCATGGYLAALITLVFETEEDPAQDRAAADPAVEGSQTGGN